MCYYQYMSDTKTKFLTETEYVELDAMSYRLAHDIKTIDDCQNVAEEVAAGFVKADNVLNSVVSINNHASLGESQLNVIDIHDDQVWYGLRRLSGGCTMWATRGNVDGEINQ